MSGHITGRLLVLVWFALWCMTGAGCAPPVTQVPDGGNAVVRDSGLPDAVVGEPDPNRLDNDQLDSDCDGLSDAEEFGTTWPSGNQTDPGATDSDGDGIRDGVEVGRTSSVDPRCDNLFVPDGDPSTHTDPSNADTDGDGLEDGEEDANHNGIYDRMVESDPKNPDSDGDGVCDGPLAVAGACTAGPDPTPIATSDDADGDGLPDPLDAAPNNPDRDGDGLCDGPESVAGTCISGEDMDADGIVDPGESDPGRIDSDCDGLVDGNGFGGHAGEREFGTDPANADSDGDGLLDGLEVGVVDAPDPGCLGFVADADPTSSTDPGNADSDGDGLPDGAEDANQNGRLDPGEFDPRDATDGDDDPTAQAVCKTDQLVQVDRHRDWVPDLQIATAIRTPDAFTEKSTVAATLTAENTTTVGLMGFNPDSAVTYLVLIKEAAGNDVGAEESADRARVAAAGALAVPITTQFTTWDGYPAVRASYDQSGTRGVKAQANAIVRAFYPDAIGLLTETNDVAAAGGYKVQAEYVRRSAQTAVVLVALVPADRYTGQAVFTLDDTANGTALAQFRDSVGVQCDRFESTGFADVDFLWAVDNSRSMEDDQAAVAAAGAEMGTILGSSTMNWRLAVVTSEYYESPGAACTNNGNSPCRNFTTDITEFTSWFTSGEPGWVTAGGSGEEHTMEGAWLIVRDRFLPSSDADPAPADKIRRGAHLVVILLTDAEDQRCSFSNPTPCINEYTTFFGDYDPGVVGAQQALLGGVLCVPGQDTGCDPDYPRGSNPVIHTVINNLGGVIGDLKDTATIRPTILQILAGAAGAISPYVLTKPAISATIKVAIEANSTVGPCNWNDVPRDRANGFDYDPISRTIVFYGDCRPDPEQTGARVSVSYRYWIDQSPDADPGDGPCGVCGLCPGISTCDIEACICRCEQTLTCADGFRWDQAACDCLCDTGALACGDTREPDAQLCACVCLPECGGCPPAFSCQSSLCECIPDGG